MMDLSNYSLAELRDLESKVKAEVKGRQAQELDNARKEILKIAESVGMPLELLMGSVKGGGGKGDKRKQEVAVKFRHPDDSSKQWTGRGRQPGWIKEWEAAGNDIEKLRVA